MVTHGLFANHSSVKDKNALYTEYSQKDALPLLNVIECMHELNPFDVKRIINNKLLRSTNVNTSRINASLKIHVNCE